MKYNSEKNKTTIRIKRNFTSPEIIKKIKESEDFCYLEENKLNYVFLFNGIIQEAEKKIKDIREKILL
jgi:hypothetical protein